VETAEDGIEGLKRVHLHPPDLVLLDVMMPNMDGHEVCRQLKRNLRTQAIPVIMLTAKSTEEDKVAGLGEGANDYLTKPFEMRELILRVRNMLSWGQVQRGANPLTGLPGNNAIKDEVERRLAEKRPFAFLYIDIDHFKVFNDYYGYGMGDQAIQHTGRVLLESVERKGGDGDFVGHIGGDDFVIVTVPERADPIALEVVETFDRTIPSFFRPEDRARGYLEVENRRGEVERFQFMTLTVAIVSSTRYAIDHYARLSDVASELKRYGKTQGGSTVVRERRVERSEPCPAGEASKPPRP
jgi:diguanylate cyclase (GGDEF)-like protein